MGLQGSGVALAAYMGMDFLYATDVRPMAPQAIAEHLKAGSVQACTPEGVRGYFTTFRAAPKGEPTDQVAIDAENGIFTIFDGTNGSLCAKFLKDNFLDILRFDLYRMFSPVFNKRRRRNTEEAEGDNGSTIPRSTAASHVNKGWLNFSGSELIFEVPFGLQAKWIDAISNSFYVAERMFFLRNEHRGSSVDDHLSGASVASAIVTPIGLVVANIGETVSVLGAVRKTANNAVQPPESMRGIPVGDHERLDSFQMTARHTCDSVSERKRIAGSHQHRQIYRDMFYNRGLLKGQLRITRAIGSYHLKDTNIWERLPEKHPKLYKFPPVQPYVICMPEYCLQVKGHREGTTKNSATTGRRDAVLALVQQYFPEVKFMLMGSSGFWQLVDKDEAVKATYQFLEAEKQARQDLINQQTQTIPQPAVVTTPAAAPDVSPEPPSQQEKEADDTVGVVPSPLAGSLVARLQHMLFSRTTATPAYAQESSGAASEPGPKKHNEEAKASDVLQPTIEQPMGMDVSTYLMRKALSVAAKRNQMMHLNAQVFEDCLPTVATRGLQKHFNKYGLPYPACEERLLSNLIKTHRRRTNRDLHPLPSTTEVLNDDVTVGVLVLPSKLSRTPPKNRFADPSMGPPAIAPAVKELEADIPKSMPAPANEGRWNIPMADRQWWDISPIHNYSPGS
ncbi:unnamed protein product [Vitrella brassicaformis CCMP3155]|uniref:PPM-type phosphatase domain-containing protein n=2 Tax=Vitrella brassicaformis TaxID=1169539 RepID=A0A0G4F396_VITBC|nr:unnamed protein product [Vitrella brassicaformis CCMP3155]|eukprot:CEM06652.1 unnamed protein product [Vitrella brassicaformis CCMP3155]